MCQKCKKICNSFNLVVRILVPYIRQGVLQQISFDIKDYFVFMARKGNKSLYIRNQVLWSTEPDTNVEPRVVENLPFIKPLSTSRCASAVYCSRLETTFFKDPLTFQRRNLFYIRNLFVPRSKHFPPLL